MNLLQAALLGLVQGLTEWLPISSSGHLAIFQQLLGLEVPLLFDIALHGGTLIALLAFFWKDIVNVLSCIVKLDFKSKNGKITPYIIYGTLPIVIFGLLLHDFVAQSFANLLFVGVALIATGVVLYATKYSKTAKPLDAKRSFVVGIAQAAALFPGVSRSGFTISTARILGVGRETAFKFSFLLAIPAVIGANLFELRNTAFTDLNFASLIFGASIAAIVGYFSLKLLHKIVMKNRIHLFAYYCWILGAAILFFSI